jgi:NADH-quinone oxidoreductase subunit J
MSRTLLFYVLSALALGSAGFVVSAHNLFRGALGLIVVLLSIAGVYLLIGADFLSAVQITVYVGGIMVLIVYVVLLVADVTQKSFHQTSRWRQAVVGVLCVVLAALLTTAVLSYDFSPAPGLVARSASVAEIGRALLSPDRGGFVLPFEAISLVLIAAVVGAITVAREGEPGPGPNRKEP